MSLTELATPGSFTLSEAVAKLSTDSKFNDFIYLSFVTLTTLGYGDIAPVTPVARMLSSALAVAGQLYVTIFIARLVGLQLTSAQSE